MPNPGPGSLVIRVDNTVKEMMDSWRKVALRRRLLLLALIIGPCLLTARYMPKILPRQGHDALEIGIVVISCILMAWIALGFWTAMFGFFTLLRRVDRHSVLRGENQAEPIPAGVRTAVLMPICNEDVNRVMAGLQVTYESLAKTGQADAFDFFILSDSSDPDVLVEEEVGWDALCRRLNAFGRVFYRRRKVNLKRKSGNVAEFCRRYGKNYRYMIVLDADSIMAGSTMTRLVKTMERNPKCGLLQTLPICVNRETPLARVQQFASQAYGRIFSAGLYFWLMGDSLYWGHNGIIRVAPFMEHCGLPRLPGKPPLGGDIMSHDFVESALLCRYGWEVRLAYEIDGSYEETPPTLLDELKRDRRWCQGNLQHLRLALFGDFRPMQRIMFLLGAMSYLSAPLWLLLIFLGTAEAIMTALAGPSYFPAERCLFPTWPVWSSYWAMTLLTSTAILLFLPKLFVLVLTSFVQRRADKFGGMIRLAAGIAFEILFSTLLAPIRLLCHTRFVLVTLMGRQAGWNSQHRGDRAVSWGEAVRFHIWGMLLAVVWGTALFLINRPFLYWILPLLLSLAIAPLLTVWSSRVELGRALQKWGLLHTPAERNPSWELLRLRTVLDEIENESEQSSSSCFGEGFVRAVVDPRVHGLHCDLLPATRRLSPEIRRRLHEVCEKGLQEGPAGLTSRERKAILNDRVCLTELHSAVWALGDHNMALQWGIPS
ncbi:MAG: glucans biosynthesis glucosyltransferase MdoH [Pseudomonadota bacterium]